MRNIMVDIETLDTHLGGLILSIGAVIFNGKGIDSKQHYHNIDVLSSLMAGFTVDQKTVDWWNQQSMDTFNILKPVSVRSALISLSDFIERDDLIWAKGPDFDLVLLSHAYDKLGLKVPWSFRNARDVRTMLWLGKQACVNINTVPKPKDFIKHFALHDAIYQASCMIEVAAVLGIDLNEEG